MPIKSYNYGAVPAGTALTNGDTATAALLGATTIITSNGNFLVGASAMPGRTNCLTGTTQNVSGTAYVSETIASTTLASFSVEWTMPVGGLAAGLQPLWVGFGGTRMFQFSVLSTEQTRLINSSGANSFTSTVSGGIPAGDYRTDIYIMVNTTDGAAGTIAMETYLLDTTTPIAGLSYSSSTFSLGTSFVTTVRHGIRTSTGTADENMAVRMRYDPSSAYFIGVGGNSYEVSTPDNEGISDATTVTRSYARTLGDSIGVTDTGNDQALGYGLSYADAVALSDSSTPNASRVSGLADSLGMSDAVSTSLGTGSTNSDSAAISDTMITQLGRVSSTADALGLTDAVSVSISRTDIEVDALGIADAMNANLQRVLSASPADVSGITDSIELGFYSTGFATAGDGVTLTDVAAVTRGVTSTYPESVSLTDSVVSEMLQEFSPGELITLSDAVAVTKGSGSTTADTVTVTDGLAYTQDRAQTVADLSVISDTMIAQLQGSQSELSILDAVGVTDTVLASAGVPVGSGSADMAYVLDSLVIVLTGAGGGVVAEEHVGYPNMPYPDLVIDYVRPGFGRFR